MTEADYKKKIRSSKAFKDFRDCLKIDRGGIDEITLSKLRKGWNCHHKCMKLDEYDKLYPARFSCLNNKTHDVVHFLFRYYQKDEKIIERLEKLLKEMKEVNE